VHVAPGAGIRGHARFVLLIVQLVCPLGLIAIVVGIF